MSLLPRPASPLASPPAGLPLPASPRLLPETQPAWQRRNTALQAPGPRVAKQSVGGGPRPERVGTCMAFWILWIKTLTLSLTSAD